MSINITRPLKKPFIDYIKRIILLNKIILLFKPFINPLNIIIIKEP
jgi:hypothetical protein